MSSRLLIWTRPPTHRCLVARRRSPVRPRRVCTLLALRVAIPAHASTPSCNSVPSNPYRVKATGDSRFRYRRRAGSDGNVPGSVPTGPRPNRSLSSSPYFEGRAPEFDRRAREVADSDDSDARPLPRNAIPACGGALVRILGPCLLTGTGELGTGVETQPKTDVTSLATALSPYVSKQGRARSGEGDAL